MDNLLVLNPLFKNHLGDDLIKSLQQYFNQLWQLDNVVLFLGAGFSKGFGGPTMKDLAMVCIPRIIKEIHNNNIKGNIKCKFLFLTNLDADEFIKIANDEKNDALIAKISLINLEDLISKLIIVSDALHYTGDIDYAEINKIVVKLNSFIVEEISKCCPNINAGDEYYELIENLKPVRSMLRRILASRRPTQPRIKIFTCNYDNLIETACDYDGIICNDGFSGTKTRKFNPANYDLNVSFINDGQTITYYPDYLCLYKIHGGLGWKTTSIDGVPEIISTNENTDSVIYPSLLKYKKSLEMPYGELFRKFGEAVTKPQTCVICIGYGFMDDHINEILSRGLKNPSAQLVILEPLICSIDEIKNVQSKYLKRLIDLTDYKNKYENGIKSLCIIGGESSKMPQAANIITYEDELDDPLNKIKSFIKEITKIGE